MIKIKLMTDYDCWPLWWAGGTEDVGDIDPSTLPLKEETIKALEDWAAIYDSWLNQDDPGESGPHSDDEANQFEDQGVILWGKLREELSGKYDVSYFSNKLSKLLNDPKELESMRVS